MRAVVQRVTFSRVMVAETEVGKIDAGLMVLLGVGAEDNEADIRYLVDKIINLRIFEDNAGKMNLSVKDVEGQILVVSQFTLYGDCRKGRRPSFGAAAAPELANDYYEKFVQMVQTEGINVATGQFQTTMMVEIHNYGPVTMLLDSKKLF